MTTRPVPYSRPTRNWQVSTARYPVSRRIRDGGVTVWFGPKAPAGHENNWVQTMPGKGYNGVLRLYGPLQPWFNKTWKPGDFELQP